MFSIIYVICLDDWLIITALEIGDMVWQITVNAFCRLWISCDFATDFFQKHLQCSFGTLLHFYLYSCLFFCSCSMRCWGNWTTPIDMNACYVLVCSLFPTMPRHNLYKIQPQVKALCAKYNIPYKLKSLSEAFADIVRYTFLDWSQYLMHFVFSQPQ